MITKKPLTPYEPQRSFLSLMMTGDEKAIGSKFGITFTGRWVWRLKDWIDRGFMKLFDPNNLFNNYEKNGCSEPLGNDELFEEKKKEEKLKDEKDEQEGKEE
jgi:hypothetical protein